MDAPQVITIKNLFWQDICRTFRYCGFPSAHPQHAMDTVCFVPVFTILDSILRETSFFAHAQTARCTTKGEINRSHIEYHLGDHMP